MIKFLLGGLTCMGAYHIFFEPLVVDLGGKIVGLLGAAALVIILEAFQKSKQP